MRADVRPAFADNEPRVVERGGRIYVNGFYRHGFLLSPYFAERAALAMSNPRRPPALAAGQQF
jgi:glycine oxidase